ncbi:hypothetical protein [Carboxydothermus pertinax]|uniref:Uncharacterized protein n=1 Tax=Carboxydothermus pertinax TaxID=870242 RepID=A0A1L8CRP0_9THEO|nr:hypothetical protein [Carboxydothermus pertinax]GAV21588.1 hypothetical protein cpu_00980 [Carboxydothermus pertinax]
MNTVSPDKLLDAIGINEYTIDHDNRIVWLGEKELMKLKDILIRLPYEKKVTGIEAIGWRWQARFED